MKHLKFVIIGILILMVQIVYAEQTEENVFILIANKCSAMWSDTGYAKFCFIDQMKNMEIFETKYAPIVNKHEHNLERIKEDIAATIIISCYFEYFDEKFLVSNYRMVNVCCETWLGMYEQRQKEK